MTLELPERLRAMLAAACRTIKDTEDRMAVETAAVAVASLAWRQFLVRRPATDNRSEHEFIVLGNILRIAQGERLSRSELRIAVAFAFLHDTHFIPRITEWQIRAIERQAEATSAPEEAARLRQQVETLKQGKATQRTRHMQGGAANARRLLPTLASPLDDAVPLFAPDEVERCAELIAHHDDWKLGIPYPRHDDRLAISCVEGDALWPLHPLGIFADLERPNEQGEIRDIYDPGEWQRQAHESLQTLFDYRRNWPVDDPAFVDRETIFRTRVGWELFDLWRRSIGTTAQG